MITPKFFCGLLLCTAFAMSQTVEGTVINSATGEGLANILVEILTAGDTIVRAFDDHVLYSATTDTQGYFRVDGVQDGAYTAHYRSMTFPFVDESMTPGRAGEARNTFQVIAGKSVKLDVRMMPLARITGRVVDPTGQAVLNAGIELNQPGNRVRLSPTDAHGNFDLRTFPGVYTLAVVPPADWKLPDSQPDDTSARAWVRIYYPGVTAPEAVSKIVLSPGGNFSIPEMKLQPVLAHAVRGVILHLDGKPAASVLISVEDSSMATTVESNSEGVFEFPAVVDGPLRLSAAVENDGVTLRSSQWTQMAGHDLDGVKLRLNPPFNVTGRVLMDTPNGTPPAQPPSMRLSPVSSTRSVDPPVFGTTDAEGNFSLEQVYPGAYRLAALEPPPGHFLDSVRLGDAEQSAPAVELSFATIALTVVYKANGGTLRGKVEKCASGGVVLVPQDPALRWPELVRTVRCASNDRYEFTAVRPGEYYAQAFARDPATPFWTPTFDESLLNQATRISIKPAEDSSADLRVITQ